MSQVLGVVLAAGRSSRMGRSKALLPCPPDGETFVTRAIRTLERGGVAGIVVVGRGTGDDLEREVTGSSPAAAYIVNLSADLGQLSSLLVAIEYAHRNAAEAVMFLPVDMPSIRADTVRALVCAFAEGSQPIVRAVHGGRHGHPVIVASSLFDEFRRADPAVGARAVLRADPSRIRDVEVDDPGVLRDVDTPLDYQALLGERG